MKRRTVFDDLDTKTVMLYDILNGIYSGIPACCVAYYAHLNDIPNQPFGQYVSRRYKLTEMPEFDSLSYVPCPDCIKTKNFVPREQIRKGAISVGETKRLLRVLDPSTKHT